MGKSNVSAARAKAAKANRKAAGVPEKPSPQFPLFPHLSGRWARKIRLLENGTWSAPKLVYFGKTADDPKGEAAAALWATEKGDWLAGVNPREKTPEGEVTLKRLCNDFLNAKRQLVATGELSARSFQDYEVCCERLIEAFGAKRSVSSLKPSDFGELRTSMATGTVKAWGPVRLGNEINKTRVVFTWGFKNDLLDRPVKYGTQFDRPSKKVLRVERDKKPRTMEAAELTAIIAKAGLQMKAQILLGLNCGYGNNDVGKLPLAALDLANGWATFARPKTGIGRKAKLWPETVDALKAAIAKRPEPKPEAEGLVFVTRCGESWSKDVADSPTSKEFRKLLNETGAYKPGRSFYTLRHCFQTQGDESGDEGAVRFIMGHAPPSNDMSANYRQKPPSDARLEAVAASVRAWLFAKVEVADGKAVANG